MKAVIHSKFGPPKELKIKEIEKPLPKDNEILIKIHTSTVTSSDCNMRDYTFGPKFLEFIIRLVLIGVIKPKINILGVEMAGEVEDVGKDVKLFKKGDLVFGSPEPSLGAHAEYICIPENKALTKKPGNIS